MTSILKYRLKLPVLLLTMIVAVITGAAVLASPIQAAAAECFKSTDGNITSIPCSQLVGTPLPPPLSGPIGASYFQDDTCYLSSAASLSEQPADSSTCESWRGGGDGGDGGGGGAAAAGECDLPQTRYGIPTWYKYLPGGLDPADGTTCRLVMDFSTETANGFISIGLAVTEILLFLAGIIAVAFIVYGGFRYVLSQGNPDQTKTAKDAVLNAVIGLIIAILATTLVRFVAAELSS